jgi:hypothetical protein
VSYGDAHCFIDRRAHVQQLQKNDNPLTTSAVKEHVIGTAEWIRETHCELPARFAALTRGVFANPQVALYSRSTKSAGWSEGEHEATNPQSRMANSLSHCFRHPLLYALWEKLYPNLVTTNSVDV